MTSAVDYPLVFLTSATGEKFLRHFVKTRDKIAHLSARGCRMFSSNPKKYGAFCLPSIWHKDCRDRRDKSLRRRQPYVKTTDGGGHERVQDFDTESFLLFILILAFLLLKVVNPL